MKDTPSIGSLAVTISVDAVGSSIAATWTPGTLLAIIFAVLLPLMFAPHSGRGLLRFAGYAHGPFFIMPGYVDRRQLVLQTIFIAAVFALIVNIPWRRRRKKDDRE